MIAWQHLVILNPIKLCLITLWGTAIGYILLRLTQYDHFSTLTFHGAASVARTTHEVPFYLYPPEEFKTMLQCDITRASSAKHSHINFFLEHLSTHPWRTTPEKAKLFVVPMLGDYVTRDHCTHDSEYYLNDTLKVLNEKGYIHHKRHFIVLNDFKSVTFGERLREAFPKLVVGGMENLPEREGWFGIGYSTTYAVRLPGRFSKQEWILKNVTATPRKYFVEFIGQVDGRDGYRHRKALFDSKGVINDSVIITPKMQESIKVCAENELDRCVKRITSTQVAEIREQSKFSLALRGDTLGGDRFQNAMAAGAIPVSVVRNAETDLAWLPFSNVIPYKDFIITIDEDDWQEDPVQCINLLHEISEDKLSLMRETMARYRPDYDWAVSNTRYTENILLEAEATLCVACDA